MSRDLVDRLKRHIGTAHKNETEAAEEIERLRAALSNADASIQALEVCYEDKRLALAAITECGGFDDDCWAELKRQRDKLRAALERIATEGMLQVGRSAEYNQGSRAGQEYQARTAREALK